MRSGWRDAISGSSRALAGAAAALRRGLAGQQSDQRIEELRLVDRLAEISVEEPFGVAGFAPAERAEEHERQRGAAPANLPGQRDAVHLRHVHVEDREVERIARLDPAQRLVRRFGVARVHAPFAALQREHAPVGGIVVDDEHALARELGLRADEIARPGGLQRRRSAPRS